jgi:nucleoid DNA-binding protein
LNTKNLVKKSVAYSSIQKEKGVMILNRVFDIIKEGLLKDKHFQIEDFGNFEVEHREMKTEIDYSSKSEILIPPKDKIKFTPLFTVKKK